MGKKKNIVDVRLLLLLLLFLGSVCGLLYYRQVRGRVRPCREAALQTVQEFAQKLNYQYEQPERLYPYMTEEFKAQMSCDEFVEAFKKERSYPYLTPLFINYESIQMAEDNLSGTAYFSQAARLPGMVYELPFIYQEGQYRVIAFEDFPDGSYLEKFEDLSYSLDSYFDVTVHGAGKTERK